MIEQATREKRAIAAPLPVEGAEDPDDSPLRGCVIPVGAEGRPLGFLYLEWREDHEGVGPADLGFLDALAGQLTLALDRARLMERERLRQDEEKTRLMAELSDLREAIQHSQMVYESGDMDAVLATARRVAPTDVTVLINGESGTGKELLARTIHQLSKRRDKPLVVVDCGSIATSLIDSELFGHERGAYTGADQRTTGRLAEADGGTVLLDEIGELPLAVQSKILRFVQEKQCTRVGSTQAQQVDARVIAVTNRDLAAEVAAGSFRADLFHRLNVVRLLVPPLRERPEDVLALTRHFLERFATQYGKRIRRLSPAAERIVRAYAWPGNIRELENRMMRAVVLCDGDQIEAAELELNESGPSPPNPIAPVESTEDAYAAAVEGIRGALADQIDAVRGTTDFPPPVGKWVGDDLVLEAYRASRETLSRAAALLAIPETTFRRRLRKARAQSESGLSVRPGSWDPVRERIARLIESGNVSGEDVLERIRGELLNEVALRFPRDIKRAAAFLGVTEPTYRRWVGKK